MPLQTLPTQKNNINPPSPPGSTNPYTMPNLPSGPPRPGSANTPWMGTPANQQDQQQPQGPTNLGLWQQWEDLFRGTQGSADDIGNQYKQFLARLSPGEQFQPTAPGSISADQISMPDRFSPISATNLQMSNAFSPITANMIGSQGLNANLMPDIASIGYRPGTSALNPEYDALKSGYSEFAKTGGFNPQQLAALRARGVSPIRAVYSDAQQQVSRQKSLAGGYSPGFAATTAKMAREKAGQLSEATTNVEASLADRVQQGKLSGLSGLAGIGEARAGREQQMSVTNLNNQLRTELANADIQLKKGQLDQVSKNRIQELRSQINIANQRAGLQASGMNLQGQTDLANIKARLSMADQSANLTAQQLTQQGQTDLTNIRARLGMANQGANLTAQQLTQRGQTDFENRRFASHQSMQQALQSMQRNMLSGIGGQTQLYGTTPAMLKTFGDQISRWFEQGLSEQELQMRFMIEAKKLGLDVMGSGQSSTGGGVSAGGV